jgi:outer membrane protein
MKKTITVALELFLTTSPTLMLLANGGHYLVHLLTSTPFLKRSWIILPTLLCILEANGQDYLAQYVADGLRNNEVVRQKDIALEKALVSLSIAKGMFTPSINVQGSYTSGTGGRSISLPVGDMLNPVYATLNELTDSDQFEQIENVNQNFFPKTFYDARIRTSLPILNTDLLYNHKIQQQKAVLQEFEVIIYKRELVENIKVAYFNYLAATEIVKIYKGALEFAKEGRRVNASLLSNGRGLPAYLLRAESEVENIHSQITDSERQAHNAQLYFNFLLNRDGEALIMVDENEIKQFVLREDDLMESPAPSSREELIQLRQLVALNQTILRMDQSFWIPKISGFADIGSQSQNWAFDNQSRYYLVGLQLDIPLFAGLTNRNKIQMAKLDVKNSELDYSIKSKQLDMRMRAVNNEFITARQNYRSAEKQLEAARSYQRLIDKGFNEGSNTFIETLDARAQLTAAQLKVIISQYHIMIADAHYERELASFPLNK